MGTMLYKCEIEYLWQQTQLLLEYNEQQFVFALREGNEMVFESVFKDYYNRLCNYAFGFVDDSDEAEEMVQNTFLNIWESREKIEIHTSIKSYLYRSVQNNCLNRIKHEKVRQTYGNYQQHHAESFAESASQLVISHELQNQISEAFKSMPPQCRTVFELSRYENLTYAEIAEQLGISIKTVDKHMIKALKIMRDHLKEYLPLVLLLLTCKN
jgi:RNA polymerase sigma-70 factor, ECF subfamily